MPIVTIGIALRARSAEKQGSPQRTLTFKVGLAPAWPAEPFDVAQPATRLMSKIMTAASKTYVLADTITGYLFADAGQSSIYVAVS